MSRLQDALSSLAAERVLGIRRGIEKESLRATAGTPTPPAACRVVEATTATARQRLGDDAFEGARQRGWAASIEEATALAQA